MAKDKHSGARSRSASKSSLLAYWGWLVPAAAGLVFTAVPVYLLGDSDRMLPEGQRVYAFDDAIKIGQRGRIFSHVALEDYEKANPVWNGRVVKLAAASRETVAFQIVVRAGKESLSDVDVEVSELKSERFTLPPTAVTRYRQWYTEVTLPSLSPAASTGLGWYPDALIPAEVPEYGLPVDVAAGQVQGVWIDIAIPVRVLPGVFRGAVTVRAGEKLLDGFEVVLTVHPFRLPSEPSLRFRAGYGGFGEFLNQHENIGYSRQLGAESAEFRAREAQLYRLLWSHRLAPTTHYSSPVPSHTGNGADLQIDWSTFDQRFGAYIDGSAFRPQVPLSSFSLPINLFSHGGWPTGTTEKTAASPGDVDQAALETAVRQAAAHWNEREWPLENAFIYLSDEPGPERYDVVETACQAIRRASRDVAVTVPFYTEFGPRGREIVERFTGCVTKWEIAGHYMNLPVLKDRQAAGDTVGFYQGSEPFQGSEALDADGLSLITWPWIAWRYGLDSLFLYNTTEWSYIRLENSDRPWAGGPRDIWTNPLNQSWQANSQGVLIYPGHKIGYDGVIPSIRLKQIRRGMQDYEYLQLLAETSGDRKAADAIARRLVPRALHEAARGFGGAYRQPGSWNRDPRQWARARRELAARIMQ